jgi:hypothetical protein
MNLKVSIASLTLALTLCLSAEAAESPSADISSVAPHGLSLTTGAGLLWMQNSRTREPFAPAYVLSIEPSYRVSAHMSFGALLSYGSTLDGLNIWRASTAGRVDFVRTRAFDAWAAGDAGLLFAKLEPNVCGDCGPEAPNVTTTRVAPVFGTGLGVDFLPIRYLSLGLETRGFLAIFGSPVYDKDVPSRVTPGFIVALNLGFHIPPGDPDRSLRDRRNLRLLQNLGGAVADQLRRSQP